MRGVPVVVVALALSGCATVMSAASDRLAADLQAAILDHTDPETVRDGAPAWLLMVDALAVGQPRNASLQAQAAQLYASYAGGFAVDDADRAKRLSERARRYGADALCAQRRDACGLLDRPYADFEAGLAAFRARDKRLAHSAFGTGDDDFCKSIVRHAFSSRFRRWRASQAFR
jgi:hypothetical protein